MKNHTLKLPLDIKGRHLVVGDIHGKYEELQRLLEYVNYDPASDVVYSVGDMIDRGPDSVKVIDFFQQEGRYAVRGNHEEMAYDRSWKDVWLRNGGYQCMESLEKDGLTVEWLLNVIAPLPFVIDVGENEDEHSFRIVHAEMPADWSEDVFQQILENSRHSDDPGIEPLLWSRWLIKRAARNVENMKPSHYEIYFDPDRYRKVIVGHTLIVRPIKCGDHWFIDTGAGKNGRLTLIDAITEERFSLPFK